MGNNLLFSVTAADCRFDFYRGSGKGGQKRNKTSSACRCTHIASGAVGSAEDHREQRRNKELAFQRMANTDTFKKWHKIEVARRLGHEQQDREEVERLMHPRYIKVEVKNEKGLWVDEPRTEGRSD